MAKVRRKQFEVNTNYFPEFRLTKEPAFSFTVYYGEETLGELTLGRGSIRWRPFHGKFKKRIDFNWKEFADLIEKH